MITNPVMKYGYIVLNANLEYNDEIFHQAGMELTNKKVYATFQEAENASRVITKAMMGEFDIRDIWYDGNEPDLVRKFIDETIEYDLPLNDVVASIDTFIEWCELMGEDYLEALNAVGIYMVNIDT